MPFKVDKLNIKIIAQVVYMCSAVTVSYAALEAAKALKSQADAQWLGEFMPNSARGVKQLKLEVFMPKLMEIMNQYGIERPKDNKDLPEKKK